MTTLKLPQQALKPLVDKASEDTPAPVPEQITQLTPVIPAEAPIDLPPIPPEVLTAPSKPMQYPTYRAERLTQFYMPDGTKVEPQDGIYTATTEEMFELLNYYVSLDSGLVTALF